jgi:hypothetical protein
MGALFRLSTNTVVSVPTTYTPQVFGASNFFATTSPTSSYQRILPVSILPFRLQYSKQVLAILPQVSNPALNGVVTDLMAFINNTYPAFNGSAFGPYGNYSFSTPILSTLYIPSLYSQLMYFTDENALQNYITSSSYATASLKIWGAIVINSAGPSWDYSIRMNVSTVPSSQSQFAVDVVRRGVNLKPMQQYTWSNPGNSGGPAVFRPSLDSIASQAFPGFLTLQVLVDRYILQKAGSTQLPLSSMDAMASAFAFSNLIPYMLPNINSTVASAIATTFSNPNPTIIEVGNWINIGESYAPQTIDIDPFPVFPNTNNPFFANVVYTLGIFFVLTFLFPLARLIRGVVLEKETKVVEGMRMMGML